MSLRKRLKKSSLGTLPGLRIYNDRDELLYSVKEQANEIIGLREAVSRLEARNDEWEAEVREMRGDDKPMQILWPVLESDLIQADYRKIKPAPKLKRHKPPFTLNWVIPPVGSVSGGHAVIFYLIAYLESQGHTCRIYVYDGLQQSSLEEVKMNMKNHVPVQAELFYGTTDMLDCDAIFATGWTTTYPVYNYEGDAKKYYFLQDFEPMFEPAGTYHALAENSYKFGLHGISSSQFTADKARREYGMECDEIELGFHPSQYKLDDTAERKKILFYARPVTPRRGFELGVLALQEFHKTHPQYEIHFVGWDVARFEIPFPYVNHGILSVSELNVLYNECITGLVMSFTSMSLLPIEMMAAGCTPVVNDGLYNTMVSYKERIRYAEPNPVALADELAAAVDAYNKQPDSAKALAEYSKQFTWDKYTTRLQDILVKTLS